MKKRPLPISWVRWRRRRYQGLNAEGLPGYISWEIAAAEAKWRHHIAKVIGNVAARAAEVTCVSRDDQLFFTLSGPLSGLREEQVSALEAIIRSSERAV